jgi:uncharacterized protein (DUF2147 family)
MKIKNALLIIFCTVMFIAAASGQTADAIVGKWLNPTGEGQIQIYRTGKTYSGKISWLKELNDKATGKPILDSKNPDKQLRDRPIHGLEILKGFDHTGDGTYQNGTIYDPKSGKTYSCKLTLNGDKLKIRGFIGVSLLGRSETWTRVK